MVTQLRRTRKEPKAKIYRPAEIDALLIKHGLAKKDEGGYRDKGSLLSF